MTTIQDHQTLSPCAPRTNKSRQKGRPPTVTLPILLSWFMVCKSDASQCIAVLSPSQSCEAAAKAQAETLVGKGSEKRKLRCKGTERWLKSSGVVTLPFLPVRVVCLAWLKRRSSQILNTMDEMGHAPKWRGKCIRACESFCWRWLMRQGFSSVAVGCRRPCSPEAMAAALKKWVHVLREAIR